MIYNFSISHKKAFAKMLQKLNVNKVCGPDNLSYPVLNDCATELAPSVEHLFARSFHSSL